MTSRALEQLEASAKAVPENAVVQYHLGMAYFQTGAADKAKRALTKALALQKDFDGADDARKTLASIG